MLEIIYADKIHKDEVKAVSVDTVSVISYELMGDKWVQLGSTERWDKASYLETIEEAI